MFGSPGIIKQRVMEVVNSAVENAQKEYDAECIRLEGKLVEDKAEFANALVKRITSKIL